MRPFSQQHAAGAPLLNARRRFARACLLLALVAGGCVATNPAELFKLSEESPAHRAMQTRMFETDDETELLSASAAMLQDVGFQVDECVREIGFLHAVKERSAREYGQAISRSLLLILSLGKLLTPVDLHQQISATIVTRPLNKEATRHEVRVIFYRTVWEGDGQADQQYIPPGFQEMEMIRDADIYQQFYYKLSKAVFLEAHKI